MKVDKTIETIIKKARPVTHNNLFDKARIVAELLGSKVSANYEDTIVSGFVYESKEFAVAYLFWRNPNECGFNVEIYQNWEIVFGAGSGQVFVYKTGTWENKLNQLYKQYEHRN